MNAFGINWYYLLLQCVNFVIFVVFVVVIVLVFISYRPSMFSKHLVNLERTPGGLVIPLEMLEGSKDFEVRKFGKSLIVISKE